jgi:D-glycero-D-manno-heptose 1,7-bisphosphate phosphatase
MVQSQAIFVDRDGVLNRALVRQGKPYPPDSLDDLVVLEGVPEAVTDLRRHGFRVIAVTNQPDVATGKQKREVVEAMNDVLRQRLDLDDVEVCYHTDAHECACRKPRPGMLLEAARKWSIDLKNSFLVGDRWRDIEAGRRAGCRTFLIDYQYHERPAEKPDWVVPSLLEASRIILSLLPSGGSCS